MTGERGRDSHDGLLSGAYGRIALMRRAWYTSRPGRRRRLNHPVISVGNLSTGGSGKTPVVAALARLLRDRGERPVILTRGYGRRESTEGVLVVSDGERVLEPVSRSGDEPQLLAQTRATAHLVRRIRPTNSKCPTMTMLPYRTLAKEWRAR